MMGPVIRCVQPLPTRRPACASEWAWWVRRGKDPQTREGGWINRLALHARPGEDGAGAAGLGGKDMGWESGGNEISGAVPAHPACL